MLMSEEFSHERPACEEKGKGKYTWRCPEYIQNYSGFVVKDAMHGCGEYRWRHLPQRIPKVTFEGQFYVDRMEGHGVLSYADGTVFRGLFHRSYRHGPGVETKPDRRSSVGLWSGERLVRLAWSARGVAPVPELLTPGTAAAVAPHRVKLKRKTVQVKEINCAAKVLQEIGATEQQIKAHSGELYSNCTHTSSAFFEKALFDEKTFGSTYDILEVVEEKDQDLEKLVQNKELLVNSWNNSSDIVQMMRHAFIHSNNRDPEVYLNIAHILSGNRGAFGPPGAHELDCRAVLLASYRGDAEQVAKLINENNVCPDISDSVGNTALMYACVTDQNEVITFLREAGAGIDRMNDSCLTPLGMCLLRYVAVQNDVPVDHFSTHFLPKLVPPRDIDKLCEEWNMIRSFSPIEKDKPAKGTSSANRKSAHSIARINSKKVLDKKDDEECENEHAYWTLIHDIKNDNLMGNNKTQHVSNVEYVFKAEESVKLPLGKLGMSDSKISKLDTKKRKASLEISEDIASMLSATKVKWERLEKIEFTILQLLVFGADPRLVQFPQSAMAVALFLDNSNLLMKLVEFGADIHEIFKQIDNYKAIDIAMFRPLKAATLDLVASLLKSGATVNHRITMPDELTEDPVEDAGPTLLHLLVEKLPVEEAQIMVQIHILELLLDYGADPSLLHEGRTALDNAMENRQHLVETFARHRSVDLNDYITLDATPLVQLFTASFFSTLQPDYAIRTLQTFLDEGANPIEPIITPEDSPPANLITYARQQLSILVEELKTSARMSKNKIAKIKDSKKVIIPIDDRPSDEEVVAAFKEALDIALHYARSQCVRWMSVELLEELLDVVYRFEHRAWHMIVREHARARATALWLEPVGCMDAWNILKFGRKHKYLTKKVFYKALCIMLYYHRNPYMVRLTLKECESIENDAKVLISQDRTELSEKYMKHLITSQSEMYKVCFECLQPLSGTSLECEHCRMVAFCSHICLERDARRRRPSSHPCAKLLHAE